MIRFTALLFASSMASPVLAQHADHDQAPPPASASASTESTTAPPAEEACTPEHAAMGHCTLPPSPPPPPACTPEHAAMGHCTMAPAAPPPPPACTPEHAAMGHCTMPSSRGPQQADPHAGHDPSPQAANDPHAGHQTGVSEAGPPVAPPPPDAFEGPSHAADLVFDPAEMAQARANLAEEHGGMEARKLLIDRLETAFGKGANLYSWDAQFWHGGDIDKLWLKSEGEGQFGGALERAEIQGLWSRAVDPWFDVQLGIRQDFGSGPDRTHLVLGAQGLAPYWFEVDGAFFLSTRGDLTARFEAEYDLRLTQRLFLQPGVEADLSFQAVPELRLGAGLTSTEIGARLRYEIYPRAGPAVVAPYVGLEYERSFGRTADLRRAAGDEASGLRLLIGVRTWF